MASPIVTKPTGSPLGVLAERAWERVGAGSQVVYEGAATTGLQLGERARRLSGGLRRAGLAPGDRVVVCAANAPEVVATYHAVWRAGAVATPVKKTPSRSAMAGLNTAPPAATVRTDCSRSARPAPLTT